MSDEEQYEPPKRTPIEEGEAAPLIAGNLDQVRDFAIHDFAEYVGLPVEEAYAELQHDLMLLTQDFDAYRRVDHVRSSLIRIAAGAVALLALDERVRGEREIAQEAERLDEWGNLR